MVSEPRRIPLVVFGVGNVGRAFLAQMAQTHATLSQRYGVDFQPAALADSSGVIFDPVGMAPEKVERILTAKARGQKIGVQPGAVKGKTTSEVIDMVAAQGVENAIVIDTTAADGMDAPLRRALDLGYCVVMSNKRPLAGPWESARPFLESTRAGYEATVGAGLPMISTLRYLVDTGDAVQRIEGAFSGTLGYLCSRLEEGEAFSTAVQMAKAKGYTEPDPRDDLSGMDVARKALILARLAGWPLELSQIRVEPLYPAEMASLTVAEFMAQLPRLDSDFAAYMGALVGVPRYMAEVSPSGGSVSLRMVGERQAAQLRGTQNQVTFTTQRYSEYPLSVLGPGAGVEVTASAVLQDCILLSQHAV
jgi:homoserine dehydrogenase